MSKFIVRDLPMPKGKLIGHRGIAGRAPENTLIGFTKAAQYGLSWVEFDAQPCKSGEWVVFHDQTLSRITNKQGTIAETDYDVLKTLDVGSWFDPAFQNEPIPTLGRVLKHLVTLKLHPNIEIKVSDTLPQPKNLTHFLETLYTAWPATLPLPLVSSFDLNSLIILKNLDPKLPLGYIQREPTENTLRTITEKKLDTLHCDYHYLSPHLIAQCPIPILVYTVNEPILYHHCIEQGITAVFSDLVTHFDIVSSY